MKTTTATTRTKKQVELLAALKAGKLTDQNQQNLMFKILNGDNEELQEEIKAVFNDYNFEGIELSSEQSLKGFEWLKNLMVTPTGKERSNNPFGYREQAALENFDRITLKGYYDAGNYRSYYIPLYDVYARDAYGFEYHVSGGSISIVG